MEIIGYLASILIGISLGLIGGGGSILTVPVLVYLFSIEAVQATSYSLFIVGLTSLVGSITYFKKKLVNIRTAAVFGIPSLVAVFCARAFLVPAIPDQIFSSANYSLTKGTLLMLIFALLMIAASYKMIKPNTKINEASTTSDKRLSMLAFQGFVIGTLTGLVGVGGGFLIIPALVVLSGLPMKEAVGTSLAIISINSLIGFSGDAAVNNNDWLFLLKISTFAIAGILLGSSLSKKIDGAKLKPAFGWFILVMGTWILAKETIYK